MPHAILAEAVFLSVVKFRNSVITDVASPASAASAEDAYSAKSQVNDLPSENAMPLRLLLPPGAPIPEPVPGLGRQPVDGKDRAYGAVGGRGA